MRQIFLRDWAWMGFEGEGVFEGIGNGWDMRVRVIWTGLDMSEI